MGIKERRTKILISLILLSDVKFDYVAMDKTLQRAFDLSLNQKTKGTISGLMRDQLIEKEETAPQLQPEAQGSEVSGTQQKTDGVRYKLTDKGFHELSLEFPFFRFLKDRWDGKWRVLSYEIPEKKRELRDRLRREVSGWGLGPWHRSFWLTPHPIIDNLRLLVSQKEEEQYIQAFESEHSFGDRNVLIEKVWQKSALEKKYRELFKKWHDVLSSQNEKIDKFKIVIGEYVEILRSDPGLPPELVGDSWIGFEAFNIFKEIRTILLS